LLQKHLTESVRGHLAKHPSVPIIQCAGAILQLAHMLFVLIGKDRHGFWQGKDDMKIRDIEKLGFAFLQSLGVS
jgi:hypothetical protein